MANIAGTPGPAAPGPASAAPRFGIAGGHPTDEEIAAVTVALAAKLAASAIPAPPPGRAQDWADRSRLLRLPVRPGPDAWRRASLPR